MNHPSSKPVRVLGRYALYGKIAAGGMATVHWGRLTGPVGFSRTVAIKRLHPQFAKDPEFAAMFLDEARLAARIQHPNVVATVDVVAMESELFLVMDYVRGETLSKLLRAARKSEVETTFGIIGAIMAGSLHGLHAAHEAKDVHGKALEIVHRDISPQNILVGADGVARVLDFGVAKAAARVQMTRDGQMKGKLAYMSPEQLRGAGVDRRTDLFAAAVVLWESLTGKRLFHADDASKILDKILDEPIPPPSDIVANIPRKIDRVVLKGLARDPGARYQSAREFAIDIEHAVPLASPRAVGEWVEAIAGETLLKREQVVAEIENVSTITDVTDLTDSDHILKTLDPGRKVSTREGEDQSSPSQQIRRSLVDNEAATSIFEDKSHRGNTAPLTAMAAAAKVPPPPPPPPPAPASETTKATPPLPPAAGRPPPPPAAGRPPPPPSTGDAATPPPASAAPTEGSGEVQQALASSLGAALGNEPSDSPTGPNTSTEVVVYRREAARRRRTVIAAVAAALLLLLVAVVVVAGSDDDPPIAKVPSPDTAPQPASSAGLTKPVTLESKTTSGSVNVDSLPLEDQDAARSKPTSRLRTPTPAAPKPAPRPPPRAPAPKAKAPAPQPRPKSPAPRPAGECSQPFFVDAKGIRRIKPQCL